tara:strand:- start:1460 stop:2245 length:786 start_codon:yes stop_codon:yes gene_type:complete
MDAEPSYNQDSQFMGVYYAIPAMGGFNIEPFGTIPTITDIETTELDLTLALQLKVNVRTFNEKIGLIKDTNNIEILQTSFDSSDNSFSIQDISFNYQDLMPDIILDNVISVGGFSSIYRNFKRDIINYYEHANNVSLLNDSSRVVTEGRDFTRNDFVDIFTTINSDGGYDLSGQINIYQVSTILNNLYTNDPFHNRTNKIYEDGFIEGDLISLSYGLSIRLNLTEISSPHNNVNHIANNLPPPILLSKIYTVPLVLHLKNL